MKKGILLLLIVAAAVFSAAAITYFAARWARTDATPAPSSYQEKNLAVLRGAQMNDLVLCIAKSNATVTSVSRAVLVKQNNGSHLFGSEIKHHSVEYITGGGYSYGVFASCEVRIVKPPFSLETIGRIVTYGTDPKQPGL